METVASQAMSVSNRSIQETGFASSRRSCLRLALPIAALAQSPAPPAAPSLPLPTHAATARPRSHEFEPMLYCLYDGIPYSRGSRLYQGGFAMSCDLVANNNNSLVWQLVR